ncbi:hypothetical protein AB4251_18475 [Vibrio lentus]|uniref:Lipoprotein n=1 Tax=Vibrio lentus TaxID=136468 RepID=A0AB36XGM0_9VIBR|nr:hypothetical protein [Vibrio lentus]MCC4839899.1 hypothetical protein [Vibrio lentus]PMI13257.1 hypothetical protein BCU51_22745 [Vibrio lentus]PMK37645.1 hypothetical protein BCU02_08865 [Vibrio lentus]PMK41942.1 hypothetical protein BCT99_06970 [Vibrio lentus]PML34277.1 hypothetical protein BCT79_10335 [Vibrio lentus]
MKPSIILSVIITMGLSACTQNVPPRVGPDIDVYPITKSIALKPKTTAFGDRVVSDFIETYWEEVATQGIQVTWFNRRGKKWAKSIRKSLTQRGVASELIRLTQGQEGDKSSDMTLSVTRYKVETDKCEKEDVFTQGQQDQGCRLEGLRWGSMVNPQKMSEIKRD